MLSIPWYIFLLQFIAGLFLANGVPHFVQGISGAWFQTPFASPPGVGESSPVVNVLWGFLNLGIGFALLFEFAPKGAGVVLEWVFVGLGALLMASFAPGISEGSGRGAGRADWHRHRDPRVRAQGKRSRECGAPDDFLDRRVGLLAMTIQSESVSPQVWPTGP
jgi:hypothetical protein